MVRSDFLLRDRWGFNVVSTDGFVFFFFFKTKTEHEVSLLTHL